MPVKASPKKDSTREPKKSAAKTPTKEKKAGLQFDKNIELVKEAVYGADDMKDISSPTFGDNTALSEFVQAAAKATTVAVLKDVMKANGLPPKAMNREQLIRTLIWYKIEDHKTADDE